MQGKGKFTLGFLIGAAAGAAIAYLMDQAKRQSFIDSVSATAEKLQDGVVEGYYDAKDRYIKYRDKLTRATQDLKDRVMTKADNSEDLIDEKMED
ncbi:MAG: YtxH domain-containing protein [Porphyromonas sp.]|nr:YtxH domain-containing protein [Porphyromonas sp.]